MAIDKNKKYKGKKFNKKKIVDPFVRKEWYDVIAPKNFAKTLVGKVPVNKTAGTRIAADELKGRVIETCLADLNNDEDQAYRKLKLRIEDVQGRRALTNFYGMDFTADKLRSIVRKWQTLIEAHVDVKTLDGYVMRMFCIAFTKKQKNAAIHPGKPTTAYAQHAQVRRIRKRMTDIMTREAATVDLRELVQKFIPEAIGKQIRQACHSIYPLENVYIRKVKVLKTPRFDVNKLMEIHGEAVATEDTGKKVEAPVEEKKEEKKKEATTPVGDVPKKAK